MGRIEKTVFISYRRRHVSWALAIAKYLTVQGYDVFIDFLNINSGDFEQVITENIKARAHFLVLLASSALDQCNEPEDWLRREIEIAMDSKRNIVPILLEGFDFGAPKTVKHLTGKLENLNRYNALRLVAEYFDEGITRLCNRFLSVQLEAVNHPISSNVQKIIEEQKVAVAEEADITEEKLSAREWVERAYLAAKPEEKIRLFTRSLELDSTYVYAYIFRGDSYADLGQHEQAIQDYNQAIKLDPTNESAYFSRASCYNQLGQYEQAIKDCDEVIKLDPTDESAYFSRGHCYNQLGQFERAIEDCDKAIKLDTEGAEGYYNKACSYALQGLVPETLVWLRQALTKERKRMCNEAKQDSDFEGIRETAEFQDLLKEFCDKR
jgi:tetratricopeptide (TPR) repeat protein